jgi:hypothetical protein
MRKTMTALGGTIASTALLILMATNAMAIEPGVSAITITGSVPPITYMPPPKEIGSSVNASLSGSTVTIAELADDSAHQKASNITIEFTGLTTNYAAKVGLYSASNGLTNGEFTIPYTAKAQTGTMVETPTCQFSGAPTTCVSSQSSRLEEVNLEVEISTYVNGSQIVPAGTYTDTLTLKVGASL